MIDRFMGMAVGQIARCINQDCLNIFLMSTDESETYREFCPICRSALAFAEPDDEDQKSDC